MELISGGLVFKGKKKRKQGRYKKEHSGEEEKARGGGGLEEGDHPRRLRGESKPLKFTSKRTNKHRKKNGCGSRGHTNPLTRGKGRKNTGRT